MLEIGDQAPDFTLLDQEGEEVALSMLTGAPVLVYFYPKDDTSGCTAQACGIRDQWSEFEAAGAVVLGISPDPVDSHRAFAAKHELPHRLLADTEKEVIKRYGAWGTKSMYGREYEGVIRSSVLIDTDGTVAAVWPKIQPKKHADAVLRAIGEL
ncbi:MAG: thioredoxin-dependent thiol peroxidase [Nitriliruptoraceae bacterium]